MENKNKKRFVVYQQVQDHVQNLTFQMDFLSAHSTRRYIIPVMKVLNFLPKVGGGRPNVMMVFGLVSKHAQVINLYCSSSFGHILLGFWLGTINISSLHKHLLVRERTGRDSTTDPLWFSSWDATVEDRGQCWARWCYGPLVSAA